MQGVKLPTVKVENPRKRIPVYSSDGSSYASDFGEFLRTTDQKSEAGKKFPELVAGIDGESCYEFGCGSGDNFNVIRQKFPKLTGIDFNKDLLAKANEKFPDVPLIQADLRELSPELPQAACGVESHVKYYIGSAPETRRAEWDRLTDSELRLIKPGGSLINILQNTTSSYQSMIRDLIAPEVAFDLRPWAEEFARTRGLRLRIECTEAFVRSPSLESALRVGIFMLNLVPAEVLKKKRPTNAQLGRWINNNCFDQGIWTASCRQDHVVFTIPT